MKKRYLIFILLSIFGLASPAFALPTARYEQNINPFQNSTYDFGTSALKWRNVNTSIINNAYLNHAHAIYAMGDSISDVNTLYGTWGEQLQTILGVNWNVHNVAISGNEVAEMCPRFTSSVITPGDAEYVTIQGTVNDLLRIGDSSVSAIETCLQTMYTAAHNAGIKVIAINNAPWAGNVNWNAGHQTATLAVNTWIANTATNIDYRVDEYTAMGDPLNPTFLNPLYDGGEGGGAGDGLHPNRTGRTAYAQAIANAVPFTPQTNFNTGVVGITGTSTYMNQDVSTAGKPNFKALNVGGRLLSIPNCTLCGLGIGTSTLSLSSALSSTLDIQDLGTINGVTVKMFSSTGVKNFAFLNNGKFEIGSSTPLVKLQVEIPSGADGGGSTNGGFQLVSPAGNILHFGIVDGATSATTYAWGGAVLPGVANLNVGFNTNGGNFGIGTPSGANFFPARLTVRGLGTGTGIVFETLDSAGNPGLVGLDNGAFLLGTTTPINGAKEQVAQTCIYTNDSCGITITDGVNGNKKMTLGYDASIGTNGAAYIKGIFSGVAHTDLLLDPDGGKVGVGTSTPAQLFSVAGKIYSAVGGFQFPDGTLQATAGLTIAGGTNTLIYTTSANTPAALTTANSSILVTNSGGTPAWGTTLPAHTLGGLVTGNSQNITGLAKVSVGTTATNDIVSIATAGTAVYTDPNNTGTSPFALCDGTAATTDNCLFIGTNTTGRYSYVQASKAGTGTNSLLFQAGGGNIGVGTTTPNVALDVNGDIQIEKGAPAYTGMLVCYMNGGKLGHISVANVLLASTVCTAN